MPLAMTNMNSILTWSQVKKFLLIPNAGCWRNFHTVSSSNSGVKHFTELDSIFSDHAVLH
jgi:hypothetical protein